MRNNENIRLNLNKHKYSAILETFITPDNIKVAAIAGGCFTKKSKDTKTVYDIYVVTNHKDTKKSILDGNCSDKTTILNNINSMLINPVAHDAFITGDSYNQNVICQANQTKLVSWSNGSESMPARLEDEINVKIYFTIQEINRIDSLLNMFQLEPCKMAFKGGKFHFSEWFVRGGPIIAEGHEPRDDFVQKYLDRGFNLCMDLGWGNHCYDFNK